MWPKQEEGWGWLSCFTSTETVGLLGTGQGWELKEGVKLKVFAGVTKLNGHKRPVIENAIFCCCCCWRKRMSWQAPCVLRTLNIGSPLPERKRQPGSHAFPAKSSRTADAAEE